MIEIILLYIFARRIGKQAKSKGLKPLRYQVLLILSWFIFEFLVGGLGYAIFGETELACLAYLLAIFGAFLGAGLAFLILRIRKPVDPQEVEYAEPSRAQQTEVDYESDTAPPEVIAKTGIARLHIKSDPLAGQVIQLFDGLLVGQSPECDLRIPDNAISLQHLRIRYAEGSWFVQDLGSAQGTSVNGNQVSATRLKSGDRITIGSTNMVFLEG